MSIVIYGIMQFHIMLKLGVWLFLLFLIPFVCISNSLQYFNFSLDTLLYFLIRNKFILFIYLDCNLLVRWKVESSFDHCIGSMTQSLSYFVITYLSPIQSLLKFEVTNLCWNILVNLMLQPCLLCRWNLFDWWFNFGRGLHSWCYLNPIIFHLSRRLFDSLRMIFNW
jgi:hypothetical protein